MYFVAVLSLVHFDAVRLRFIRRAAVQILLGLVLLGNNLRVLYRERAASEFVAAAARSPILCSV